MKPVFKTLAVFLISSIVLIEGCKKEDKCRAGLGGNVNFTVYPQHHGAPIPSKSWYPDTVFVKFNTSNFPGDNPTLFDTLVVGKTTPGHAEHIHVNGLTCGDYYFYAVGFDTTISQRVAGGIPYSITQTAGEIDLDIPVTE